MLQTNLKVVAVGEPDLETLTDGEKRALSLKVSFQGQSNCTNKRKPKTKTKPDLKAEKNYTLKT